MPRRYQKPRVRNKGSYWIAQYRDLDGRKRKSSPGPIACTKKSVAEQKLANILEPINTHLDRPRRSWSFSECVSQIYLPFYRRKWKRSTTKTNEDRIWHHLTNPYGERLVSSFRREELQDFLEQRAAAGLSCSVVAHLRMDLRQVFRMAREEGRIERSPAELLFVPSEAKRPGKQTMTFDQVRLFFSVLLLRERVIGGLGVLAEMGPGEIFGLTRGKVEHQYADIEQRVYRGEIGTPKTFRSKRWAAFGSMLKSWLAPGVAAADDGHWTGRGAVPVREDDDAVVEGRLLASGVFAPARAGRTRMGGLSGYAPDELVPDGRASG